MHICVSVRYLWLFYCVSNAFMPIPFTVFRLMKRQDFFCDHNLIKKVVYS